MIRIPYIPTAYPDETFRSLIARIILHNGKQLWSELLRSSGYGQGTIIFSQRIPLLDKRLENLLSSLGYSYEEIIKNLTEIPFWSSFAKHKITDNLLNKRYKSQIFLGQVQNNHDVRYCPACLLDDINDHGEPYLHRQHQLPVSLMCAKHAISLRTNCRSCGDTVIPYKSALFTPLALRCKCGQDLTEKVKRTVLRRESYKQLSQFASDILNYPSDSWTQEQVFTVLANRLDINLNKVEEYIPFLLQKTYRKFRNKSSSTSHIDSDYGALSLYFDQSISSSESTKYSAALSATGISYSEFRLTASTLSEAKRYKAREINFINEASQSNYNTSQIANQQSTSPALYREVNTSKENKSIGNFKKITTPSRNISSIAQRDVEDSIFLINLREKIKITATINDTQKNQRQLKIAINLSRTIFSILKTEHRPTYIDQELLSRKSKIPVDIVRNAIYFCEPLKNTIQSINADKDRRKVEWSVKSIIESGKELTTKSVLNYAELLPSKRNRQLCNTAIQKFTGILQADTGCQVDINQVLQKIWDLIDAHNLTQEDVYPSIWSKTLFQAKVRKRKANTATKVNSLNSSPLLPLGPHLQSDCESAEAY